MKSKKANNLPPIVFIHGAWHGPWSWSNWKSYFEAEGFKTYSVELRGHGNNKDDYKNARLKDYINDSLTVIDALDNPPILIGHSMGASIVQGLLQQQTYPAAVLVAPVPDAKIFKHLLLKGIVTHPLLAIRSLASFDMLPWLKSGNQAEALFFSPKMNSKKAHAYASKMQGESLKVFTLDLDRNNSHTNKTPLLLLAAENDSFFKVSDQIKTAEMLISDFVLIKNSGHDIMLDASWQVAAEKVCSWIMTKHQQQ